MYIETFIRARSTLSLGHALLITIKDDREAGYK